MKPVEEKINKVELKLVIVPFNPKNPKSPIFIECQDGSRLLPIFSTKEKYLEAAKLNGFDTSVGVNYEYVVQIAKLLKKKMDFRLVLDPEIVDGNTRFQLIPLDESDIQAIKGS